MGEFCRKKIALRHYTPHRANLREMRNKVRSGIARKGTRGKASKKQFLNGKCTHARTHA